MKLERLFEQVLKEGVDDEIFDEAYDMWDCGDYGDDLIAEESIIYELLSRFDADEELIRNIVDDARLACCRPRKR